MSDTSHDIEVLYAWHRLQALLAERAGDHAAAELHLDFLSVVEQVKLSEHGWFISGPSASATVDHQDLVEITIKAFCEATGDEPEEYTVTDLGNPVVAEPDVTEAVARAVHAASLADKNAYQKGFEAGIEQGQDDRTMLEHIQGQLAFQCWVCPSCGTEEDCSSMDIAQELNRYLETGELE